MHQHHPLSTATILAVGALAGAILTAGLTAFADGNPETDDVPRMIPYQGTLEMNGVPVNAQGPSAVMVTFALFDGLEAEEPVYAQTLPLEVFAGRFTAFIGPMDNNNVSIAAVISAADDLYLGMTILGNMNTPDDDIVMSNRQRLLTSPYAMWSTHATNFTIARQLDVGGNASIDGHLTVAQDNITQGRLIPSQGPNSNRGIAFPPNPSGDHAWIRYSTNGSDSKLQIGINDDPDDDIEFFQDGSAQMRIGGGEVNIFDDLNVAGDLVVDDDLTVAGDVKVNGRFSYDGIFLSDDDCRQGSNDKTDCFCPDGSTVIGGGGLAQNDNTIREMRAIPSDNRWRISCGGTDNNGHCINAYALCATIIP